MIPHGGMILEQTMEKLRRSGYKMKTKTTRGEAGALAARQHATICRLLNEEPIRSDLLADRGEGTQSLLLKALLISAKPVKADGLRAIYDLARSTISKAS